MFETAEGVMGDARDIARQMLERGERAAPYPPNSTSDEALLESTKLSFEIDGTEIFLGFLRAGAEE